MASANDLIRDMTERFVRYIETPKETRRAARPSRPKEAWQYRWFGLVPVALKVWEARLRQAKLARRFRMDK